MAVEMYRIRVDGSVCSRRNIIEFLDAYTSTWFLVEENGDVTGKHHYQGYYYAPKKCNKTLRVELKKRCENPARGSYSLPSDPCTDGDGWRRYLCKGNGVDSSPVVVPGSTIPIGFDIVAEHASWYANRASYKKANKTANGNLVDEAIEEFRYKESFHRHELSRWVLRRFVDARKPINIFYVRSIVNLVSAAVNQDEFERLVQDV